MHELVTRAAEGVLPEWAIAGQERRAHMHRVGGLLGDWAEALELGDEERRRWVAAGILHDVLRDADPRDLRERVPPALQDLPGALLHGPAAAERLRIAGVEDGEVLAAVAFHTVGDPGFGGLGRALYAADFLDPGRTFEQERRDELRKRMPGELDAVVHEIVRARLRHLLDKGAPLRQRTFDFWNRLARELP